MRELVEDMLGQIVSRESLGRSIMKCMATQTMMDEEKHKTASTWASKIIFTNGYVEHLPPTFSLYKNIQKQVWELRMEKRMLAKSGDWDEIAVNCWKCER